ncbi:hypothetical protein DV737_g2377, partial [Chaetothyriales sp. CBS 132003]
MDDAVATPRHPQPPFSSSPGFGTPAYPVQPRRGPVPSRAGFAQHATTATTATGASGAGSVLPILLPAQTLRPVAFRTLTKKHNLTLTSSALALLATFIGKFCGTGWREESLAERLLDEVAKAWKAQDGGILVEDGPDKKLSAILKSLEPCMLAGRVDVAKLSRTNSFSRNPLSRTYSLGRQDSQSSLGVAGLPRLVYSTTKKTLETVAGDASLLPAVQRKTAMFRNRYNLIHQRLLRHESFQTPSFASAQPPTLQRSASSVTAMSHAYKITPISNLLGRSGSSHLLLGLLALSPTSDLCLTDLSGSVVLDTTYSRCVPEDGAWFCCGMIVLVAGTYEEDGSNNSTLGASGGPGGQIKGRFVADTFAGPLPEKREASLGINHDSRRNHIDTSLGPAFGWVDFLGLGSEKAVGQQMRQIRRRILGAPRQEDDQAARRRTRSKIAILGECHLDSPRTLEAIRSILRIYSATDQPLAIVLMGNFVSAASMAGSIQGGGSVEYKEHFDALASVLSEFPRLLATTTFVFVPGDNDPWASSFGAGAATCLPRQPLPDLFTSRVRRAFTQANNDHGSTTRPDTAPGAAVWSSNPARISLFGPVEEVVLFRDDLAARMRRNSLLFPKLDAATPAAADDDGDQQQQQQDTVAIDTRTARKLVKSLLDQSHLSPFPLSLRPVLSDYASALSLCPLPTALLLCDPSAPRFCVTYEACVVVNPGRNSSMFWAEYDVKRRRAEIREGRF